MPKSRRWISWALIVLVSIVALAAVSIGILRRAARADFVGGPVAALTVSSSSFVDGGRIPATYTCKGSSVSPALTIAAVPAETKSIAIIADDLDAPVGFVHWVVFNVPPGMLEIPEGAGSGPGHLPGALQGKNDFDRVGYAAPCPPLGEHRYIFRIYALRTMLDLPQGATKPQVVAAAKDHVLAEGQIVGLYRRGQ
jgi:Raf kinase inhibitor-like YbhB/YbcL family protein